MELTTTIADAKATIQVVGKLSVATSPELESEVTKLPESITEFVLDLTDLEYVSSAGLRVLVMTQKLAARRGGTLTLLNTTDDVQEVLEMTGLADVFDIKR